MIVARRTAPIDARRGLAGNEASILPEILARPGAAAAVQAVDDRGSHAPCFQDQARHASRQRAAFADRATGGGNVLVAALGWAGGSARHSPIRSEPSAAQSPPRGFRPRRAR